MTSSPKIALITGVTGQDGSYLVDLLLQKGYIVHGIKRRSSSFNTERLDHFYQDFHLRESNRFFLHYGDMTDGLSVTQVVQKIQPDEIYNLAAMSHVRVSFDHPEYVADSAGLGALRILESIKLLGLTEKVRYYQASTSELYGKVQQIPQDENTPFYPRSPYGIAKLFAYWTTVNYREAYGLFACNGILFNHESPVRGETFVTRKITMAVANIALGLQKKLFLGNLNSKRDWGHAKDYVDVMWRILQYETPEDWVVATGKTTTIRDFVKLSFAQVGIELEFEGSGLEEKGFVVACSHPDYQIKLGEKVVEIDPYYFRPTEVDILIGNSDKAYKKLKWKPCYDLEGLVKEMVDSDLKKAKTKQLNRE